MGPGLDLMGGFGCSLRHVACSAKCFALKIHNKQNCSDVRTVVEAISIHTDSEHFQPSMDWISKQQTGETRHD